MRPQPRDAWVWWKRWEGPSASGRPGRGACGCGHLPAWATVLPSRIWTEPSKQRPLSCWVWAQPGRTGRAQRPGLAYSAFWVREMRTPSTRGVGPGPGPDFRRVSVLPRLGPRPWDAPTFISCRGKELLGAHGCLEERGASGAAGPRGCGEPGTREAGLGSLGHEGCPLAHMAPTRVTRWHTRPAQPRTGEPRMPHSAGKRGSVWLSGGGWDLGTWAPPGDASTGGLDAPTPQRQTGRRISPATPWTTKSQVWGPWPP